MAYWAQKWNCILLTETAPFLGLKQIFLVYSVCKLCVRTFHTVFSMSYILTQTSTSKFYCLFQSLEGRKRGSWGTFSQFLLKGKNYSARSERLSPLTLVSGWGEEVWKDDRGRGGEKEEQLHDLKWCWLDDIESSCAKVEESNAFSLSLSFLYSLPSLAFFCLAAKPS